MKLLLHYLKFDFRRWRGPLLALWGLLAVYLLITRMLSSPGRDASEGLWGWYQRLAMAGWCVQGVAALCAAAVCLSAAAVDSPVASDTWLLTRPRRARQLVLSRLLLVFGGVVLPGAVCYALSFVILGFDAATTGSALRESTLALGAAAVVCMLWAVMNPFVPGLLGGALAGSAVWLGVHFVTRHRPEPAWMQHHPPLPGVLVLLAVPALLGVSGFLRRQSQRRRVWTGFHMGVMVVAVVALMPAVEYGRRLFFPGGQESRIFPEKSGDWELPLTSSELIVPLALSPMEATWDIPVQKPVLPDNVQYYSAEVEAVAWRSGPEAAWSDWVKTRDQYFMYDRERDWLISFSCDPRQMRDLTNGELRLHVHLVLGRREIRRLPLKAGARERGEGWTWELLNVKPEEEAGFSFTTAEWVCRHGARPSLFAEPDWESGEAARYERSTGGGFNASTPAANYRWTQHRLTPRDQRDHREPLPEYLRLVISWPRESVHKTVHVTGVNLSAPVPETRPVTLVPLQEGPPEFFPGWIGDSQTGPRAWPAPIPSEVPDISADSAAVARYLTSILRDHRGASDEDRLAALVPQHLNLFLEMTVRYAGAANSFYEVLIAGTPEDRRGEILRLIPQAPVLVLVAIARDWGQEARPYVLEMAKTGNMIPVIALPLCRSYRDPAFHPFMRRHFTADEATVRYWESMPDLAPDLPAELEKIRARLHAAGDRIGRAFPEEASVLLYTGDSEALAWLLEYIRDKPRDLLWPRGVASRWLRDASGNSLNMSDEEFQAWLKGCTAQDFTFHRGRRLFIRKPAPAP